MVPLATLASSATRSTVVPCIPYRAITRRAASSISRTRYSLITSSFVTAKLGSQSNERSVSLGKLSEMTQPGECRIGREKTEPSVRRLSQLIAQNFSQPLGRNTAQIRNHQARRRRMTAAAEVLREHRQIDIAVGATAQADALASQVEQRDDRPRLPLVELRRDFAAVAEA